MNTHSAVWRMMMMMMITLRKKTVSQCTVSVVLYLFSQVSLWSSSNNRSVVSQSEEKSIKCRESSGCQIRVCFQMLINHHVSRSGYCCMCLCVNGT